MSIATANTNPISPARPAPLAFVSTPLLSANVALTGTGTLGTDIAVAITAGVDGARVNRVRVAHRGTNVATVMRFFVNNGLTNGTAGNNSLVAEVTVPANTLSQVAAAALIDVSLNQVLPAGYRLLYTIGTAVAAGHAVTCPDAGEY